MLQDTHLEAPGIDADEYWDVPDESRSPTGRKHRRGDDLPPGDKGTTS